MDGLGVRRAHRSGLMNFLQRKKFSGRFIYFTWFLEAPLNMHKVHNFAFLPILVGPIGLILHTMKVFTI